MMNAKIKTYGKRALALTAVIAELTLQGCASSFAPASPDSSEADKNALENSTSGLAKPILITDPRKKGTGFLHPDSTPEERKIESSPVFDPYFVPNKQQKKPERDEKITYHERIEGTKLMALAFAIDSTETTRHRYYQPLRFITDLDNLEKAELGQALDGGSVGLEASMIYRNYMGGFADLAHGARDINGIHFDNQMGDAAEKEAGSYDYWAHQWAPDTYSNATTVYGSTATATGGNGYGYGYGGDANAYSSSKSAANASADLWFNQVIRNSVDNTVNNKIEGNGNDGHNGGGGHHGGGSCERGCSIINIRPGGRTLNLA